MNKFWKLRWRFCSAGETKLQWSLQGCVWVRVCLWLFTQLQLSQLRYSSFLFFWPFDLYCCKLLCSPEARTTSAYFCLTTFLFFCSLLQQDHIVFVKNSLPDMCLKCQLLLFWDYEGIIYIEQLCITCKTELSDSHFSLPPDLAVILLMIPTK